MNEGTGAAREQTPPVDYTISARLDDAAGIVRGSETIRYRNLTPDSLGAIWLHLYANALRDRSTDYARELEAMGRFDFSLSRENDRGWTTVDWVESGGRVTLTSEAGTELGLTLNPPLAPGESVAVSLGFRTKVARRFGELARSGRSFVLAHWYPEVAARSPDAGWLLGGYHVFGHSPAAFGDYHVTLDVAADLNLAAPVTSTDSGVPGPEPGRRVLSFEARGISIFAVAAAPVLKQMSRKTAGTNITILSRSFTGQEWYYALMTVAGMLRRMQEWCGPFPFANLSIVDGSGVVAQDASYPGLIVMATRPIPYTRAFELALAQQVALQWTACATGADELNDPGTTQGPAAYSAMRYMDEKYGRTSLITQPVLSWLLRGLNTEYYHKVYYYLGASNRVLCRDVTGCRDQVGYQAAALSGPALLLLAEERRIGRPAFDSLMSNWLESVAGSHPARADFASIFPLAGADLSDAVAESILPTRLGDHSVTVRPLFALPSFADYQIFYGPYVWWDWYHQFQLCGWAMGRQFIDTGPLRGRHQWMVSEVYGTGFKDWHTSINYQTPLTFLSDRLRVYVALDESRMDDGAKIYFRQELGPVFRKPQTTIDFGYRILQIQNDSFRDKRAWEKARTADLRAEVVHTYESRLFLGALAASARRGLEKLGSEKDYFRLGLAQVHTWRGLRPLNLTLRLFGGYVWGDVPLQDRFYLSGGLVSNSAEPVSWAYEGIGSGQEHWHYDADVNCRGWAGEYRHGSAAYGLNLEAELPRLGFLSFCPFFDIGNVLEDTMTTRSFIQPRMDAGLRLKLGPLYADFPFWRYQVGVSGHEFAFRWMLGLKVSGSLGNI
ncbi:hypothetical protein JXD38_05260 [candidate division WOR-3 bacterium]|nr:hypothetical protein [candidate division WOR-3 bacterium]